MIDNKQVNKMVAQLVGDPELYDVRYELKVLNGYAGVSSGVAEAFMLGANSANKDKIHSYTITSSLPLPYSEDLNLAMSAIKKITDKLERGAFILSIEDEQYKAVMGDWRDNVDYVGNNPAYVSCIALLKYFGKL